MATSSFILKDVRSESPTLIYFVVRHNGTRLKYSTGEHAHPGRWSQKEYKAGFTNSGAYRPTAAEKITNTQLSRYTELFDTIVSNAKLNRKEIDLGQVRALLDKEFKKDAKTSTQQISSLSDFVDIHIKTCDKQLETRKGYNTTLNKLIDYEKDKAIKLQFDDITLDFYYSFLEWLNSKGYATNTIGGHIKNIKVFMDVAFEKGLHNNEAFRSRKFKVVEEDTVSIYLTEDELTTLYTLDLTNNLRLDRIRDLFIVGCRTGLRFSDLSKLTPEKIIDNGSMIQIRTQKTGEVVYIPLHWQTRAILKKYDFELPTQITNQKFNDYLKELAELAEINTEVTIYRTYGGINKATVHPKHELITVHTARRTFATLAYKAGMESISIRKITGHRTDKSFQKYIKLSNKEHAELMAKHEFFTPLQKVN